MGTERISQLCERLARDATLQDVLTQGGVNVEEWDALYEAVLAGADPQALTGLLDRIDLIADHLGLDPVTSGSREYRPLPTGLPGYRSVEAWRCPHQRACGRSQVGGSTAPTCGLTGDALEQIRVVSG
ncbi:hypothetical protein [Actinophytocola xanthii]|uniref:hypothetical protein n=1 Tax=Actinophytocola xanthii TaxID=1912961 RepID=UPI0011786AE4|nr:hypothetical protein [Actinophytocola xanthii]